MAISANPVQKTKFIITNHARERFVERFPEDNRRLYAHLKSCNSGCPKCVSLTYKLKKEVDTKRDYLDKEIIEKLKAAKEIRVHHNNSEFMSKMMAKYGDVPAKFLLNGDMLFLMINKPDGEVCVTCFDAKNSILGDFVRRPKFKKKS